MFISICNFSPQDVHGCSLSTLRFPVYGLLTTFYYMRVVRRFYGGGVLDVGGYPGLILGHVPLATCWTGAGHWRRFINVIMVQVLNGARF